MSVELLYRIVNLVQIGNTVKIVLQEVRLIPKEEIERAQQEAKLKEKAEEDVGEQLQKVIPLPKEPTDPTERLFWAMRRQFPEMVEALEHVPHSPKMKILSAMGPAPVSRLIDVYFTPEQYVELGSPLLLSILKVSMKMEI